MAHPREIYDLLLDYAKGSEVVREVLIGLTWTLCRTENIGLAMSPGTVTRTLPWSGTLVDKSVSELALWVRSWNSFEATVGMAAVNAAINGRSRSGPEGFSPLLERGQPISTEGTTANLAVFQHFLPQIRGKRVAIIGRYPRLSVFEKEMEMTVIERQPTGGDLPDPASEYVLPESEWVFLTATSIVNKTFPRLVELARDAKLVLMGPTMPWLPELAEFGIDYLAGVSVTDSDALRQTVAEGGGVRIFETGVQYRVLEL